MFFDHPIYEYGTFWAIILVIIGVISSKIKKEAMLLSVVGVIWLFLLWVIIPLTGMFYGDDVRTIGDLLWVLSR